jgi:hypothetical protein
MSTTNNFRDLVAAVRVSISEAAIVHERSICPYEFRTALFQWVPKAQVGGWVFDYKVRWSSNIPRLLDLLKAQAGDVYVGELETLLRIVQLATVEVECGDYDSVDLRRLGFRFSGEQVRGVSETHGQLVGVFGKLKRNTSRVKRVVMLIEAFQAEAEALGCSGCIAYPIRKGQDLASLAAFHQCRLACEPLEESAKKLRAVVEKFSHPEHTAELLQATDFIIEKGKELMW